MGLHCQNPLTLGAKLSKEPQVPTTDATSDRLGIMGPKPMLLGDLMWLMRGYLYNLCCGEMGCIYYRQVHLAIGFAWLCERW